MFVIYLGVGIVLSGISALAYILYQTSKNNDF